mmetsp:Transcript_116044/g.374875  ORF Transcript_116044/g.374875 Transcript_116044/m.374875 type:complete len:219 (-) Transcript_116044:715-1371(-)
MQSPGTTSLPGLSVFHCAIRPSDTSRTTSSLPSLWAISRPSLAAGPEEDFSTATTKRGPPAAERVSRTQTSPLLQRSSPSKSSAWHSAPPSGAETRFRPQGVSSALVPSLRRRVPRSMTSTRSPGPRLFVQWPSSAEASPRSSEARPEASAQPGSSARRRMWPPARRAVAAASSLPTPSARCRCPSATRARSRGCQASSWASCCEKASARGPGSRTQE